jgi:hypothetical protein
MERKKDVEVCLVGSQGSAHGQPIRERPASVVSREVNIMARSTVEETHTRCQAGPGDHLCRCSRHAGDQPPSYQSAAQRP